MAIFSNFFEFLPILETYSTKKPSIHAGFGNSKKNSNLDTFWTLFGHLDTFFEIRMNFSKKHKKLNGIFSRICFAPQFEKRNIIPQKWPFLTQKFEK